MVRERLFDRLSEHGPVLAESINAEMPQLRVTLTQFVQVYAADGSSNDGVVGLQAVLVRDGKVLAQFRATESQRATENTAPAGAAALRTATDRLIDRLLQWLSKTINQS
jgi:cholesterol transport system auxiliary component